MNTQTITIFHSPDADDAFMFYGLSSGAVSYPGFGFRHELKDIESLNQLAKAGKIDVTAVSVHAFAYLDDQYVILNSGASMGGETYGPRLVVKESGCADLSKVRSIALPGPLTSATLAMRMYLVQQGLSPELYQMPFDRVQEAVAAGEADAGVIIHEGQLTHQHDGLKCLVDLGAWWWQETALPLPLGVNVVRKSLGTAAITASATVLKATIEYSLAHRAEALEYALRYGRGISRADADTFVGMYVNDLTVDLGETGRRSITLFLERAAKLGLAPVSRVVFAATSGAV